MFLKVKRVHKDLPLQTMLQLKPMKILGWGGRGEEKVVQRDDLVYQVIAQRLLCRTNKEISRARFAHKNLNQVQAVLNSERMHQPLLQSALEPSAHLNNTEVSAFPTGRSEKWCVFPIHCNPSS